MEARQPSSVDRIYEQVRLMAASFEIKPDERINEGALARTLGASRTPVREALNRLVAEGFLTFQTGKGFFCRSLDPDEILDLYEVRAAIECEAARLACQRASDEAIADLSAYLDGVEKDYSGDLEPKELVGIDECFHLKLARLSGNEELVRMLDNINARIRYIRWIDMEDRRTVTPTDHRAIVESIQTRAPDQAADAMRRHIERRSEEATSAVRRAYSQLYVPKMSRR
ncbi:GntR family transcriptional regulator [Coralliovum pocilloporae]|uniref:GntR family transcriptional regulator n=1 Tax=Coralliovum pocilloporae TaxID=3066369 RepID=UPI003306BA6A